MKVLRKIVFAPNCLYWGGIPNQINHHVVIYQTMLFVIAWFNMRYILLLIIDKYFEVKDRVLDINRFFL